MTDFGLYAIMGTPRCGQRRFAEICAQEGLAFLQLRMKASSDREILSSASLVQDVLRGSPTRLLINDRVDLALMSGAQGVHLGQEDAPAPVARSLLRPGMVMGLSTHSLPQARESLSRGPDYIAYGPICPTTTKARPDPVVGTEGLPAVLKMARSGKAPVPLVAIGGLGLEDVLPLARLGVRNLCMVRPLMEEADPRPLIREVQAILSTAAQKEIVL